MGYFFQHKSQLEFLLQLPMILVGKNSKGVHYKEIFCKDINDNFIEWTKLPVSEGAEECHYTFIRTKNGIYSTSAVRVFDFTLVEVSYTNFIYRQCVWYDVDDYTSRFTWIMEYQDKYKIIFK